MEESRKCLFQEVIVGGGFLTPVLMTRHLLQTLATLSLSSQAAEAGQGQGGQAGPQLTLLRHHPQQTLDPGLIFMFRKKKETGVKGHLLRSLLLQGLEIEASAEKRSEAAQHQCKQQEPADPGGGLAWGSVSSLLSINFIIPLYFPGC